MARRDLIRRLVFVALACTATMVLFAVLGVAALGPAELITVVAVGITAGWAAGRVRHGRPR